MNENSPVQAITGQVDVVYDKAIIEIEKEESDLESQISRLVEKKSVLSRKSQLLNQLRVQVEQLTEEITTVEELYKTELKKKEELEQLKTSTKCIYFCLKLFVLKQIFIISICQKYYISLF